MTDGSLGWEALPEELASRVMFMVRDRAYKDLAIGSDASTARLRALFQLNHAFHDCMQPLRYLLCPLDNPHHAKSFVKGMFLAANDQICRGAPLITPFYSHLYGTVYTGCTRKAPNNLTESYYEALESQMKALVLNGTISFDKVEERSWFFLFIYHVFRYIDRFYVVRLMLPKLQWSLRHWYQEAASPCLLGEPNPPHWPQH